MVTSTPNHAHCAAPPKLQAVEYSPREEGGGGGGGEGVIDSELLAGIAPEDLTFSFNTSIDKSLPGHVTPTKPDSHTTSQQNEDCSTVTSGWNVGGHDLTATRDTQVKSCYDKGTFYGLPVKVKQCLKDNRGIESLYGEWACGLATLILIPILSRLARLMPEPPQCGCR